MPTPAPRTVHDLVEQQVQRWMAEQQRRAAERVMPEPHRPIITVSRQAGADGTALARTVAERLGYRMWDQELVHRVAERTGASEALLRILDERAHGPIEDLLGGILMGETVPEGEYVGQLVRVIHAITLAGSAVVVGRGAQFVVASDAALHVRVVAPFEERCRRIGEARSLSPAAARGEVERIDRERLTFMRHSYHRDASDPAAYDLVVNTGTMPLDRAADVVVAAYRAKFGARS